MEKISKISGNIRKAFLDDGISSIMAALPQFHSKTGSLISLSNSNRTAQRNQPTQEFNNGVVLSAEPLRNNQLFEVKIVKKVISWQREFFVFRLVWCQRVRLRRPGMWLVGQATRPVVVAVSCVCTRLWFQYFTREGLCRVLFLFDPLVEAWVKAEASVWVFPMTWLNHHQTRRKRWNWTLKKKKKSLWNWFCLYYDLEALMKVCFDLFWGGNWLSL